MLDIGWTEIVVVAVVTLVVLGPKELPRALKTFGAVMSKARAMAREFQSGVDEMIRESELDDLRKDLQQATRLDFDESPPKDKRIDPTSGEAAQPALPAGSAPAGNAASDTAVPAEVEAKAAGATTADAPPSGAPGPDAAAAQDGAGGVKQVPASSYVRPMPPAAAATVAAGTAGPDRGEAPPFGANRFDRDYAGASEAQAMGDFLPPEAEPDDAAPAAAVAGAADGAGEDSSDAPTGTPARAAG